MTTRMLFVCLGNICRSPTAEGVFRARAAEQGVPVSLDSAGTGGWHVGNPPDRRAVAEAAARGIDITGLRARQATPADFDRFDLILAMDRSNAANIERVRPTGSITPVRLFLEYAAIPGRTDVPDPYYEDNFADVFDLLDAASRGLLARLRSGQELAQ
jgi:protein-tyrosine phosphatase